MSKKISELLDVLSNYIAHRKGLLPLIGLLLVVFNLILNIIPFFPNALILNSSK